MLLDPELRRGRNVSLCLLSKSRTTGVRSGIMARSCMASPGDVVVGLSMVCIEVTSRYPIGLQYR